MDVQKISFQQQNVIIYLNRCRAWATTGSEEKHETAYQRENPFFVDTVRALRSRYIQYKKLQELWNKRSSAAQDNKETRRSNSMCLMYESLQRAHKFILNSLHGA